MEISFYRVLPDVDVSTLYGYQPALSNEIFERVKINITSLLRKHKKANNQNNQKGIRRLRGRGSAQYKPGFRGRGRGSRGGKYAPGFRGRGKGKFGLYHSKFDVNAPAFKPASLRDGQKK